VGEGMVRTIKTGGFLVPQYPGKRQLPCSQEKVKISFFLYFKKKRKEKKRKDINSTKHIGKFKIHL
jgi:hypothetical protein